MEYSAKSMTPVSQMQPISMKNGKATIENSTAVAPLSDFLKRLANLGRNLFRKFRITMSRVEAAHGY